MFEPKSSFHREKKAEDTILFNSLIKNAANIYIMDANINTEIIDYIIHNSNCNQMKFIYHTQVKTFDNIYITHEQNTMKNLFNQI